MHAVLLADEVCFMMIFLDLMWYIFFTASTIYCKGGTLEIQLHESKHIGLTRYIQEILIRWHTENTNA